MKAVHLLYDFVASAAEKLLPLTGIFSEKMDLFTKGRKNTFSILESNLGLTDKVFWFHASSLGEYEQAVPVMTEVKNYFPEHKLVVSFFSPSGFENKKNSHLSDATVYLPIDTKDNVKRFLDLVHPEWAIFVKYDFWPNFLDELKRREIKTLLISAAFRKDQYFFKSFGKWWHQYFRTFDHFFVQDEISGDLLKSIGFTNYSISGDTRFDRVAAQTNQDNNLDFMESFADEKFCIVAGSTWPEDEEMLIDYINASGDLKFIIAPHTIAPNRIKSIIDKLQVSTILFSERAGEDLSEFRVLIVDAIGYLGRIYSYAKIAYVGGAAGTTGLHNILEPAAFAIPVVIGKNFSRYPEAIKLKENNGLYSVASKEELGMILGDLVNNEELRSSTGKKSGTFVLENTGATEKIISFILKNS
ncbi:MAG TPA: glycosyltransferase N-terminal domain-containing protein [Salinimicrobium sp.]|nr:glycosyltransferase N-terminal domain-containing protein [Salinimicrobium sp.]